MKRSFGLASLVFAMGCGASSPPPAAPTAGAETAPSTAGASAAQPTAANATAATAPAGAAALQGTGPSQGAAPSAGESPTTAPKVVTHVEVPASIAAIVAAPDRSRDDMKLDAGRHPAETLAFFGIAPGMHVGEIVAGGGYTTELLARAVAPNGVVYGENPKGILERYAAKPWAERLAKPADHAIVRVDRELDDPFPPEASNLDAVVDVLFYHDTVWLGVDRDAMNKAIFKALKPGGVYGIVDHAAKAGDGVNDVKTLHRIEESVLKSEIERAGFRLDSEATFLANPADRRDWSASPKQAGEKRGTSDRFVLKFVKP
ncbi:MAG TPA: SAM-dependent methyltransferase [Polyangiaceae bacterium]|jgi:predicted methyltransferase|nr:SAM-dependent methyltransferase [Polyangiaceae bacterium]